MRPIVLLLSIAVAGVVACAPADGSDAESSNQNITGAQAPPAATAAPPAAAPAMADSVHWFRNSAEMKANYLQAYRMAALSLDAKLAEKGAPAAGAWAVIFDVDETLLDNSEYQKERGALGFSADSWSAWAQRREAKATPGSVAFVSKVHALGGKVALVTNRSAADCQATQDNLKSDGFSFDSIACQTDPTVSDKNPRFAKVQETLSVLMWIGDSIGDFPGMTQAVRTDESKLADFGSKFIALPNPMYGSFLGNPRD